MKEIRIMIFFLFVLSVDFRTEYRQEMLEMLLTSFSFLIIFILEQSSLGVGTKSKSFFGPFSLFLLPPLALILIIRYTVLKNQGTCLRANF